RGAAHAAHGRARGALRGGSAEPHRDPHAGRARAGRRVGAGRVVRRRARGRTRRDARVSEERAPHAARLARHYDAKYGAEREAPGAARGRAPPARSSRHEACLTFFPRHFGGGDILEIGAGNGLVARSLAAAGVPFDHYTATEYSAARLEGLRRSLTGDARVR